eukprot:8688203-Alexandrium_andersonii.AAC.1
MQLGIGEGRAPHHAAPPAPGTEAERFPTFADSKPQTLLYGLLGVLGPRLVWAEFGADRFALAKASRECLVPPPTHGI